MERVYLIALVFKESDQTFQFIRREIMGRTYISNLVMLGKPIVVENGEHEGLVKSLGVRQVLELKSLVEKRVERLSVNLGLELFLAFGLGDQVDFDVGIG